MRKAKRITNQADINEISALTPEEASTKHTLMNYFGDFGDGPRFQPYDLIEIPSKKWGKGNKLNKEPFLTTVGIWVFNKIFIEDMCDVIPYVNKTVTNGVYKDINQKISYGVLEEKITIDQLKKFIMRSQIVMACVTTLSPSHTQALIDLAGEMTKYKKQIAPKYKDAIANSDIVKMKEMEAEVVDKAVDTIKDDESFDMFKSGARASIGNNFRSMYCMRSVQTQTDGSFGYVTSSYMEGCKPDDFSTICDAGVLGAYSRSCLTAQGGYLEKQVTNATQHIKVLPKGSDCGSKHTIQVTLTKKNINGWMYCFIVEKGGKLVEITSDNRDKYIGKTVNMRFSSLCHAKNGICEKCAGTLYRRLGIENIGLGCMIIMSKIKNGRMKAFHDATVSLTELNPDEVFGLK
jgi:hypothetical protein